jgi:hypothetical protein
MEKTTGYLTQKGKIWGLNNKDPRENSATRSLSFGLNTAKDHSLFLEIGEWKNTTLAIKVKGADMTEPLELNEQDAIAKVQELFKDGDSVFINARAEVDTFRKNIKYLVNQIYIEKEPIDFEAVGFKETNNLNQSIVIIEKPSDRSVKVGVVNFKGEMLEQELKLSDDMVNDYFNENANVGDLLRVTISDIRKPNYVEQEVEQVVTGTQRKTLKGKIIGSGGKSKSRRAIDKLNPYTEILEVTDVDVDKTEKQKYKRQDIREALDLAVTKEKVVVPPQMKNVDITPIDDSDLPF